jgi:hypothetical protein
VFSQTFGNGFAWSLNRQPMSEPFQETTPGRTDNAINSGLIRSFSLGNELAFRGIYDHYAPAIYRVSLRYFQSEPLASDLVQEVFSELWFNRAEFVEPEALELYLFTTAKDVAVKLLKKMAEEEIRKIQGTR